MNELVKVHITDTNCITPLGFDVPSNMKALRQNKSGIQSYKNELTGDSFYQSKIEEDKINQAFECIAKDDSSYTKLEKLLLLALAPLIEKNGITSRTGLILSTTKGNIDVLASNKNELSNVLLSDLGEKVAQYFEIETQPIVLSNACVSGVLAIAVGKRMLQAEAYDDIYVVAGDLVSDFVLSGFNSFQALSDEPCRPYDQDRKGVTLGEASAAVYLTTNTFKLDEKSVTVIGDGAVNDANHISGPSRTGEGLYQSIESAFAESKLNKENLDYISAHGTATNYNDEMESIAFSRAGIENVPVNSLKGYYGHTLGASGLLESIVSIACMYEGLLLASKGFVNKGVSRDIKIIDKNNNQGIKYVLKTASGFGGCNTAVLFEKSTINS